MAHNFVQKYFFPWPRILANSYLSSTDPEFIVFLKPSPKFGLNALSFLLVFPKKWKLNNATFCYKAGA